VQGKKERKKEYEEKKKGKKRREEGNARKEIWYAPHRPAAVPAIDSSSWTRLLGSLSVSWTIRQEKEILKRGKQTIDKCALPLVF
jgi:hypothetical protein